MGAFYTKFLRDIRDSQLFYMAQSNGSLPDCVPFYNHGGIPADPAWSAAYPLITSWFSEYYADDDVVAEHYDGIKAFMESQIRQLDSNGVLSFARCARFRVRGTNVILLWLVFCPALTADGIACVVLLCEQVR